MPRMATWGRVGPAWVVSGRCDSAVWCDMRLPGRGRHVFLQTSAADYILAARRVDTWQHGDPCNHSIGSFWITLVDTTR